MSFAEFDLSSLRNTIDNSERLTGNQWSEKYAVLPADSSIVPGRWISLPFQVEIIDAATSDEDVERVVWKKSSRVGATKCLLNISGYFTEHKPAGQLIVQPRKEDAEGFSKEELASFIKEVDVLAHIIRDAVLKDGSNSILHKKYPGGTLSLVGANAPSGFRRITRKVILMDETSAYPQSAGTEGDPVQLAMRRATGFVDKKIVMVSSPNLKETCSISRYFEDTDKRYFHVPCPHCGHSQVLKWSNFKIPNDIPADAYFECEKSKCKIEHKDKFSMIEAGQWIPTAVPKNPRWRGYHIWTAYSYNSDCRWEDIATHWLEAKRHGQETLKTFVNTWLGEAFDEKLFLEDSAKDLQQRGEAYALGTAPAGVVFAVNSVDVQPNRLAVKTIGFGLNNEDWIINYQEIFGNTSQPEVWRQLLNYIKAPIPHEKYGQIYAKATAVDSGNQTHEVYQFVRENKHLNVFAVKGSSQRNKPILMRATAQDINYRGQIMKRGVMLYPVGTDTAKNHINARLKIQKEATGYVHFSAELPVDYFIGIQSEKKVVSWKRGKLVTEWQKISSSVRNEALDTWVYCLAAKEFVLRMYPREIALQVMIKELEKKANKENLKKTEPTLQEDKANHPRPRSKIRHPRRGGGGFVNNY